MYASYEQSTAVHQQLNPLRAAASHRHRLVIDVIVNDGDDKEAALMVVSNIRKSVSVDIAYTSCKCPTLLGMLLQVHPGMPDSFVCADECEHS